MYTFYNTPRLLIELDKAVVLWSDWLVVCDCGFSLSALWCPLSAPTVLLGFLLPSTWGISSWLLQQSTAAAPYLGRGVAPLCRSTPAPSQPTLLSWCFWTVVLEKTLESPLDCKEIQPVHPKGDQSWVFIGRTDAEAKTLILYHLMGRVDSLEKTLMLGGIGGRRRRGRQRMRWLDGITN